MSVPGPSRPTVWITAAIASAMIIAGCQNDDSKSDPPAAPRRSTAATNCQEIDPLTETPILSSPVPLDLDKLGADERDAVVSELGRVSRTATDLLETIGKAGISLPGPARADARAVKRAVDEGDLRTATFAAARLAATANDFATRADLKDCRNRVGLVPTTPGPKADRLDGRHLCVNDPLTASDLAGPPQSSDNDTCRTKHRYESYATFEFSGSDDAFPGDQFLAHAAVEQCRSALADLPIDSARLVTLSYISVPPSATDWGAQKRRFSCFAFDPSSSQATGSLFTDSQRN